MGCIHVVSPAASARIFFDSLSSDDPSRASVVTADGVAMAFATAHSPLHCPDNRIGTTQRRLVDDTNSIGVDFETGVKSVAYNPNRMDETILVRNA